MSDALHPQAPLWFLDVDGVLNSIGCPRAARFGPYERVDVTAGEHAWPIWFSRTVVARINNLHRAGLVRILWLTTWNEYARTALAPALGLDDFEVLLDPNDPALSAHSLNRHKKWWKHALVEQTLLDNPSRPYIWTDDDLFKPLKRALIAQFPDQPARLITTMSSPGLTFEHLDTIDRFVTQQTTRVIPPMQES